MLNIFSKTKRGSEPTNLQSVICIGSSSKDVFFPTDKGIILDTPQDVTAQKKIAFELGAKYQVAERFETVGGCAANVACGLARLAVSVRCCTKIGDDTIGEWIKQQLKKAGVGLDLVQREEKCKSDLSFIIVDVKTGERTIFSDRDANEKLQIKAKIFQKPEWIFISSLNGSWQKNLGNILSEAKKKGNRVVFNPGQKNIAVDPETVIAAISQSEIVVLNKDEALEVVSHISLGSSKKQLNDEIFLLESLKGLGPRLVLVTDGIRGAWARDEKETLHVNALVVEAKDTTGAGDAFTSGFFGAIIKRKKLSEALLWGAANSSSSVREYGGQAGLLGQEEIGSLIGQIKIEKII